MESIDFAPKSQPAHIAVAGYEFPVARVQLQLPVASAAVLATGIRRLATDTEEQGMQREGSPSQ